MTESRDALPEEFSAAEKARLQEIADLELMSSDIDDDLQALTTEAAEALNLPISLVSIITDSAQYFAASHGLEGWLAVVRGSPKTWSFCQHAVADKNVFIVEDAKNDERVKHSPLVTQDGIACYLGVPLTSSRGHVLGTLCVIGAHPRSFDADEQSLLEAMAVRAVARIESRAASESGGPAN